MSITLAPIGIVRTCAADIPRHWSVSDVAGTLVLDEDYREGLRDIEPGQRIVVLFHFHRSPPFSSERLRQTSGETGQEVGVFSLCSPVRPNPIGLSVLDVVSVTGAHVDVRGLDMLDGTPILDIKPYLSADERG
jgi:tRNA-Thr(GGU) m(6)t(6)A37 methyltransferase TsaA